MSKPWEQQKEFKKNSCLNRVWTVNWSEGRLDSWLTWKWRDWQRASKTRQRQERFLVTDSNLWASWSCRRLSCCRSSETFFLLGILCSEHVELIFRHTNMPWPPLIHPRCFSYRLRSSQIIFLFFTHQPSKKANMSRRHESRTTHGFPVWGLPWTPSAVFLHVCDRPPLWCIHGQMGEKTETNLKGLIHLITAWTDWRLSHWAAWRQKSEQLSAKRFNLLCHLEWSKLAQTNTVKASRWNCRPTETPAREGLSRSGFQNSDLKSWSAFESHGLQSLNVIRHWRHRPE